MWATASTLTQRTFSPDLIASVAGVNVKLLIRTSFPARGTVPPWMGPVTVEVAPAPRDPRTTRPAAGEHAATTRSAPTPRRPNRWGLEHARMVVTSEDRSSVVTS